jgi:hypothetical protein
MAGMRLKGKGWTNDPVTNQWVPESQATRSGQQDVQDYAVRTYPLHDVDPLGEVRSYNYETGQWDERGALGGLSSIIGGTGGFGGIGGTGGGSGAASAADTASRTDAKERNAHRTTAAMRGLDSAMNARGIFGSKIHGGEMGDLFTTGLGEEAATDRGLLMAEGQRSFDVEDRNFEAAHDERMAALNAQYQRQLQLANPQQSILTILQNYGMRY